MIDSLNAALDRLEATRPHEIQQTQPPPPTPRTDLLHTKELEAQAPDAKEATSGQLTSVNQQLIEAIQMPQYDREQLQADLSRCEQLLEKLTVRVGELREDLMESAQRNTQRAEVISELQVMPLSPSHWMTDS